MTGHIVEGCTLAAETISLFTAVLVILFPVVPLALVQHESLATW
jgi:hypothetical protein